MKKILFILLSFSLLSLGYAYSKTEEKKVDPAIDAGSLDRDLPAEPIPSGRKLLSVSTDDLSATDSINRIAGNYETNRPAEESSYRSPKNERVNPLHSRSYEEVSR